MSREIAPGLVVEEVGDFIGGTAENPRPTAVPPPTPEGSPPYPGPGIYFGMPDEVYHSIYACSASGLKDMSMSSMDHWARSLLNPNREDDDTDFKVLGRAYHVRILEGRERFRDCYAPLLDKADHPTCLDTVKDIRKASEEELGIKCKGTTKEDVYGHYLGNGGSRPLWDILCSAHAEAHADKILISRKNWDRIEIAAAMIENDPELSKAFSGGYPEVALFWYDEKTGAAMKAKVDYLKMLGYSDLKSFSNTAGRPVQRAIDFTIANRKYYMPVVVYGEGIAAVKKLVRELGGLDRVFAYEERGLGLASEDSDGSETVWVPLQADRELKQWVWAWAHQPDAEALFVFQQTGSAPVTRGRYMTRGSVFRINELACEQLKRKWVACAKTYGTDPWVDAAPIVPVTDEHIPQSGTDFGEGD